jgi:hypothetical protein
MMQGNKQRRQAMKLIKVVDVKNVSRWINAERIDSIDLRGNDEAKWQIELHLGGEIIFSDKFTSKKDAEDFVDRLGK